MRKAIRAARPMARSGAVSAALGPVLAGAFGFGWFVRWAGFEPLDPTNLRWLLNGEDWGTHLLGWLFFRHEPWRLPLGRIDSYVYPVGTTIGLTDLAYQQQMTINGGSLTRYDEVAVRRACDALQGAIRSGNLDSGTVYVPGPASLRTLRASRANAICGRIDRWAVCVSGERRTRLADELRLHPL